MSSEENGFKRSSHIRNIYKSIFLLFVFILPPAHVVADDVLYAETERWRVIAIEDNSGCLLFSKPHAIDIGSMGISASPIDNIIRLYVSPDPVSETFSRSQGEGIPFVARINQGMSMNMYLYFSEGVLETNSLMAGHERIALLLKQMAHSNTALSIIHDDIEVARIELSRFSEAAYLWTKCLEFIS